MKKYSWNRKTLSDALRKIETLIEFEKDDERLKQLQLDYSVLQDEIKYYYFPEIEVPRPLLENYVYVKDELTPVNFVWDDLRIFNDLVKTIKTPRLKKLSLTETDILDITHDFYKSLGNDFFQYFMLNFRQKHNHIRFKTHNGLSKTYGTTLSLSSIEECFIDVFRKYNSEDVLTSIHEYAHATSALMNHKHLEDNKVLYSEIDSLFMELIASDYLETLFQDNNSIIFKASIQTENASMSNNLIDLFNIIEEEQNLVNGCTSNKILKQKVLSKCQISPFEVTRILRKPDISNIVYLTSFMFALELYELYKQDKEKALYYLKKIILLRDLSQYEYYSNIQEFGLMPNSSLESFQKQCEEDILSLTRKKSKPHK